MIPHKVRVSLNAKDFVRDEDPERGKRALSRALGTKYPCEKTRVDNVPELCGIALPYLIGDHPGQRQPQQYDADGGDKGQYVEHLVCFVL